MPDITAITGGLSALKTATDLLKEIRNAAKGLEDAEIKLKLAELSEALADTKLKLAEAQEENIRLGKEIKALREKQDLRSKVKKEKNVYVPIANEIEGYGAGPWCTNCFETKGILVSLHHKTAAAMTIPGTGSIASYKWECPNCKASVHAPKR